MKNWYHLATPSMWSAHVTTPWAKRLVSDNMVCSECGRLARGWFPQPIDVEYDDIPRGIIYQSDKSGIALIRTDLLEQVRPWLPHIAVGKALLSGQPVAEFSVFYVNWNDCVQPRHLPPKEIMPCIECGTIRTRVAVCGPEYLLDYNLAGKKAVVTRIGEIYVDESVRSSLDISNFKPLYFDPIEVRDAPLDGLRFPSDPEWVKGRDATEPWREGEA